MTTPALSRRALIVSTLTLGAALSVAAPASAKKPDYWTDFWGHAIRGYDAVAYFTEGRPVEGSSDHEVSWKGATWRFASADNKAAFEADPQKYAPQFGGYCAWAVSQGYTASVVPEAWDIVDGKLYLNYSTGVQRNWKRNQTENIRAGDANWPGVIQ